MASWNLYDHFFILLYGFKQEMWFWIPQCDFSARKGGSLFPISATKVRNQRCKNSTGNWGCWSHLCPISYEGRCFILQHPLCPSGLCNRNLSVDIHGNHKVIFFDLFSLKLKSFPLIQKHELGSERTIFPQILNGFIVPELSSPNIRWAC